MTRVLFYPRVLLLIVVLSTLVAAGGARSVAAGSSPAPATIAQVAPSPVIAARVAPLPTGAVIITGHGFTPGGPVYLAVYGPWGPHPFASQVITARWVTATLPTYHAVSEVVDHTGGGTVSERFGSMPAVYGPDGSQDPALGYVPASTTGSLCGATAMARAYDQTTDAWSNLLPVTADC